MEKNTPNPTQPSPTTPPSPNPSIEKVNTPTTPPQTQSQPTSVSSSQSPVKKSKKSWILVLVVALILITASSIASYLILFSPKTSTPPQNSTTPQPTPTPDPATSIFQDPEFQTKLYTTTDIQNFEQAYSTKFPEEITEVAENELTPLKCSSTLWTDPQFSKDFSKISFYTGSTTQEAVNPMYLAAAKSALAETTGTGIDHFMICETNTEISYGVFSIPPPDAGGGGDTDFYFAKINGNAIENFIKAQNFTPGAYPRCDHPLELTTNNVLYWMCGGGDGPTSSSSIAKIDFNTDTFSQLTSCRLYTDIDTQQTTRTCE